LDFLRVWCHASAVAPRESAKSGMKRCHKIALVVLNLARQSREFTHGDRTAGLVEDRKNSN
jgi:hypothetical protein